MRVVRSGARRRAKEPGSRALARPRLCFARVDLLVSARIHTLDPRQELAEAALARDGRWVKVGSRAGCEREARRGVRRLEAPCAVPGLHDAHGHPYLLGRALEDLDLREARSEADCAARVAARARETPAGAWIRGRGWDQNRWPGGAFPGRASLDAAAPSHPVVLMRVDGHAAWVNAAALAAAGIGPGAPDLPGGRILRDARGAAAVLVDAAFDAVLRASPPPAAAELDRTLAAGLAAAARAGLAEVDDAGCTPDLLASYRRLAAARALPLRVYAMVDGQAPLEELAARLAARGPREQGRLTVRAVKLFADGALGSRGAALLAPYDDDPATSGLLLLSQGELRERLRRIAAAGLQPAVHAIGDRACREVLEAYAALGAELTGLRPRVEHLQILAPEDRALLRRAGAIASMQPAHATSDGAWAQARLGRARAEGAYAWRWALEAAAGLALGSDFPVEAPDPLAGLHAAEARVPRGAREPWTPAQRLGRREALAGYTTGAAFAAFAEARRGRVQEGMDADLTLLGEDLLAVPAEEVPRVPVLGTVVEGAVEGWRGA